MIGPVTVQPHPAPAVASRPDRPPISAWRDAAILAAATGMSRGPVTGLPGPAAITGEAPGTLARACPVRPVGGLS